MANNEREQLWRDRIAQLQASGMTQRAYALEHGHSEHQVGYWVRRITKPQAKPALVPVRVAAKLINECKNNSTATQSLLPNFTYSSPCSGGRNE
jgi:DNA-binding TFAR19-related protein (PDSD5 family)